MRGDGSGCDAFNLGNSRENLGFGSYRKNRLSRRGDYIVCLRRLHGDISGKRKFNFKPQAIYLLSTYNFCCRRTQCNRYFREFRKSVPCVQTATGRRSDARRAGQCLSLPRLNWILTRPSASRRSQLGGGQNVIARELMATEPRVDWSAGLPPRLRCRFRCTAIRARLVSANSAKDRGSRQAVACATFVDPFASG